MNRGTLTGTAPAVLLIDDDLFGLTVLKDLIDSLVEADQFCHSNPVQALEWLTSATPDVIVTDYDMPEINGVELIRTIRGRPETADVPILMITAIDSPTVRLAALDAGANDFITKPFEGSEVRSRVRNMLALRAGQKALRHRADSLAAEVAQAIRSIAAREHETVIRLARAAEYRDSDTGGHLRRIAEYAAVLGRGLMLPPAFQEALYLAAPMHDIGKIAIPDYIMRKPALLEPHEYEIMQTHTLVGHQILEGSSSELLQLAAEVALAHHERWDGSGYPNNIKGEDIPIAGRIVAVADVFDALVSRRPYKASWELDSASDYIEKNGGAQFDPACVDVFRMSREEIFDIKERFDD